MESLDGLVLKATGSWYAVEHEGRIIECRVRGKIRLKGIRTTNPVVVGDRVRFIMEGSNGVIQSINPRSNYIIRKSINLSKETHIIAANIDHAYVVVTLCEPPTPLEFIDRFTATATAYNIPATILLNKQDLADERETAARIGLRYIYKAAGYNVRAVSTTTGEGIPELAQELAGRISLMAGNSGVGKSSLINALQPGLHLKTASLSESFSLGKHTTTFSEMHRLNIGEDTYVIDTPGIKGFGVVDFKPEEVSHFFPDIFAYSPECKFSNCKHHLEPGCAVIQAVEEGRLAPSRYSSYLSLLDDGDEKYR